MFLCMAATPFLLHAAIVGRRWPVLLVGIPLLQLLVIGLPMLARKPAGARSLAIVWAILMAALGWGYFEGLSPVAATGIPHALANSILLVTFAASLAPGREAILTGIARRIRGPLPDELILYSRRVTLAWCFFFGAQLIISLGLFLFAPVEVWSFFINVLNLPLIIAMFVIEYCCRLILYPHYRHDRISDIMRLFAKSAEHDARQVDSV